LNKIYKFKAAAIKAISNFVSYNEKSVSLKLDYLIDPMLIITYNLLSN